MTVPPIVLEQLLAALADELAPRVVDELARRESSPASVEEPWHLLTLDEAAARLGRSTRWVRDRVKRGDLPYVRLDGSAFAFEVADLQAFARARRVAVDEVAGAGGPLARSREPASRRGSEGDGRPRRLGVVE